MAKYKAGQFVRIGKNLYRITKHKDCDKLPCELCDIRKEKLCGRITIIPYSVLRWCIENIPIDCHLKFVRICKTNK